MNMTWIIFVLIGVVFYAFTDTIDKYVMTNITKNVYLPMIFSGMIGTLSVLIIYLSGNIVTLEPKYILLAILPGILWFLQSLAYFKAVKIEEISIISPLLTLTTVFTILFAWVFLSEILYTRQYIGIIIVLVGATIISIKKTSNLHVSIYPVVLIIIHSILAAIGIILIKYLLTYMNFWTIFSYTRIGNMLMLIPIYFLYRADFRKTLSENKFRKIGFLSLGETFAVIGMLCITFAISLGPVGIVRSIESIKPIFVILIAYAINIFWPHLLLERPSKKVFMQKIISAGIIIIGTILIII